MISLQGVLSSGVAEIRAWWMKYQDKASSDTKCYLIIILSCLFFSLCSLFTDLIENIPVNEILWWRFFFVSLLAITHDQLLGQQSPLLTAWKDRAVLLSAMFGTITACSTVFALRNLPIGEATLLLSTAPIFTVLLSGIILKERLVWSDYLALVVSTCGAVFVAQPDCLFAKLGQTGKSWLYYVAVVVALERGFFKAAKFVAVSSTGSKIPTHIIVVYLSSLGFCVVSMINGILWGFVSAERLEELRLSWVLPSVKNTVYMFLMAFTYFLQQFCVCAAMRFGKPAKASLLKYLDIVLPFLFQITVFKIYPNTWTCLGSFLIIVAMLTVISTQRGGHNAPDKRHYQQLDSFTEDDEESH